jgi:PAS domain S-box-containing protein
MVAAAGLAFAIAAALAREACDLPAPLAPPAGERGPIEWHLSLLEESGGRLTLAEVADPAACDRFRRPADPLRIVLEGDRRYWLRFELELGAAPARDFMLLVPIANFERVCTHWPLATGVHESRCAGVRGPGEEGAIRHNRLLFRIPDGLDTRRAVFVEIESRAPHLVRGELVRTEAFLGRDLPRQFLGGVFNGLLLAAVLYNLFSFAAFRDRASLFYALHLLSLGLAMVAFEGRGRELLWPWLGRFAASVPTLLLGSSFLCGCLYARDFLMTRTHARRLDAVLRLAMLPALVALPLSLLNVNHAEQVAAFAALAFVLSLVAAAVARVRAGDRPALYLLFGLSAFLAGTISVSLRVLGVSAIPDSWGVPLTRVGMLAAAAVISAGLWRRVGELRRERDRAARAEAAAAAEWRATFDAVDVGVVLLDRAGNAIRLNRAAVDACGLTFAEALGRPLSALTAGEPWQTAARLLTTLRTSGDSLGQVVRDPEAGKTWGLSLIRFTIPDASEERTAVIARDLTEVARLEESLRRREHMAAMGALVAGVAHEVRNPLFGISSTVDALEARLGRPEGAPKHLETLRAQVERLGKLMHDLLEYGRPREPERTAEDLLAMAGDASRACDYLAREGGARVELVARDALPTLLVDRKRILQVFQNLLENALRHSPPGGCVTVEVARDGALARAVVRDTGPGFAAADLPHVFEPFFTKRQGGTGLGLSIVQQIVEQHGGRVTARNGPGGGGEVVVLLPLAPPSA